MEITATKCLHCGQVIPGEEVKSHPCFTLQTEASCVKCRAWISGYLMCECEAMQGCWSQELGMRAIEEKMWARYQAEEAIEPISDPAWVWPCGLCGNLQDPNVNWEGIPANCSRCMRYICNEHGGVDAEGDIWCEICAKEHNVVLEPDPIPVLERREEF